MIKKWDKLFLLAPDNGIPEVTFPEGVNFPAEDEDTGGEYDGYIEEEEIDEDEELPEEYKGMTKKEILKAAQQTAPQFASSAPAAQTPPVEAPVVPNFSVGYANAGAETPEQKQERINQIILSENPARGIEELVNAASQQTSMQYALTAVQQAFKFLELDAARGPYYKILRNEVNATFNTLSDRERLDPRAVDWAYNKAMAENIEKVQAAWEKQQEAEASAGGQAPARKPAAKPYGVGSGGSGRGAAPRSAPTRKVKPTADEIRRADTIGVDPQVLANQRARRGR